MAERLTPREQDALAFFKSRSNPSPSLAELSNHLGVSRTRAVFYVRALVEKGWVVMPFEKEYSSGVGFLFVDDLSTVGNNSLVVAAPAELPLEPMEP